MKNRVVSKECMVVILLKQSKYIPFFKRVVPKVGLNLDKHQIIARGGLLVCFDYNPTCAKVTLGGLLILVH